MAAATHTVRVRAILDSLDSTSRAALKKLLPPKLAVPADAPAGRYPLALLKHLPKGEAYAWLGILAEALLRMPVADITVPTLSSLLRSSFPTMEAAAIAKVEVSKTTQPFLDSIIATRTKLDAVLRDADGPCRFEEPVTHGPVEGHPDMRNATQIVEVKLTGLLKENWAYFLFQVFSYGALCPEATDLYLALPLQQIVWHADIRGWAGRVAYRDALVAHATRMSTTGLEARLAAAVLCATYAIGHHTGKQKSLAATVSRLGDYSKPYQIFLNGPQSSKLALTDTELAATAAAVTAARATIFVHSQYIINLCNDTTTWQAELLRKNLEYSAAAGFRGVVVHVGKSTGRPVPEAVETMRKLLREAAEFATADCPLLLETPAGQGTETLRGMEEFLDFVSSFADPRIRMCLDTCHVFACGHTPLKYVEAALARPGLLKLVHYNDSLGTCGSCVDRHAHVGTGHIGFDAMKGIAELCSAHNIPMVIE